MNSCQTFCCAATDRFFSSPDPAETGEMDLNRYSSFLFYFSLQACRRAAPQLHRTHWKLTHTAVTTLPPLPNRRRQPPWVTPLALKNTGQF